MMIIEQSYNINLQISNNNLVTNKLDVTYNLVNLNQLESIFGSLMFTLEKLRNWNRMLRNFYLIVQQNVEKCQQNVNPFEFCLHQLGVTYKTYIHTLLNPGDITKRHTTATHTHSSYSTSCAYSSSKNVSPLP